MNNKNPDLAETMSPGQTLHHLHDSEDLEGKSYQLSTNLRFLHELGRGGMGKVYLAEIESDGVSEKVAVKFSRHTQLDHLAKEAQISSGLRNDYIAKTRSFHIIEGDPPSGAIIMDYVDGEDLLKISERHSQLGLKLPQKFIGLIGYLCCEGLAYSHRQGAIHRDIKPANIMIDNESGGPKLIDYGLGVLSKDTPKIIGEVCGTLDYISPEALRGLKIGHKTDIYSLGMTLDSLVRGESFLARSSESARSGSFTDRAKATAELQEKGYTPLSRLPGIHPKLSEIIETAVQLKPEDRYLDAKTMMDKLSGFNYEQGLGFGPVRIVFKEYLELIRHNDLPNHLNALKIDNKTKPKEDLNELIETLKSSGHARDYQSVGGELLLETLQGNYREIIPGYLPIG